MEKQVRKLSGCFASRMATVRHLNSTLNQMEALQCLQNYFFINNLLIKPESNKKLKRSFMAVDYLTSLTTLNSLTSAARPSVKER